MLRILTVDDNPTNLDLTSRMLQRAGYSVDTASGGEHAVPGCDGVRESLECRERRGP